MQNWQVYNTVNMADRAMVDVRVAEFSIMQNW